MSELGVRLLLTESVWQELHESTQQYLVEWHRDVTPLLEEYCAVHEADLTTDQIQSIFQNAEQYAVDSKKYMTKLSKVGDTALVPARAAKQLNDKINELAKKAQNTAPVENFDQKFEQLKSDIANKLGGDSSKIVASANKLGQAAKDNPAAATFIVGLLTVAGAVAGGPLGGAGVGFLMRAGKDVLTGEKLSTAAGRATKVGALGALAGAGIADSIDYDLMLAKRLAGLPLTESEQNIVNEFGWQDVKKAGKKAIDKTKQAAKSTSRELGQKVTARKLQKLWKEAGSPTDSAEIAQLLANAGLDSTGIDAISLTTDIDLHAGSVQVDSGNKETTGTQARQTSTSPERDRVERLKSARLRLGLDDAEQDSKELDQRSTPQQVTFPGTDIEFKTGWVNADDLTGADTKVASVLDKIAGGANPSELSTQELLAARRKLNMSKAKDTNESLRKHINRALGS